MPQNLLDALDRLAAQIKRRSATEILERARRQPPKLSVVDGDHPRKNWWADQ